MPRYFPLIDVLRAAAALLVLCYHVIELGKWTQFPTSGAALYPRIGWIGVDLFFVISGFVIGKSAIEGVATGAGWRAVYIERRLRRIVPLYMATLLAFLFMVDPGILLHGWQSVRQVLTHLFFVHNLSLSTHGTINGPNWSVALEMQFYLLMLLSAPWIARTTWWKVLLAWAAVAIAWRFGTTLTLPPGISQPMRQQVAATQLPGQLDGFVFGICLAKLALAGHLRYTPLRLAAWALAALVLLTVAFSLFWPRAYYWNVQEMVVLWRTLLFAGFAALLATAVLIPWSGGRLLWPLRYLGEISYGLYLWHLPVLMTFLEKSQFRGAELLAWTFVCTVVLASASWHGFEKLWLRQRAASRPTPTQNAA